MATDDGQLGNGEPNRDPITGAPGAHPVDTGLGATGGALAGAAAGSLAGPVGTVVGWWLAQWPADSAARPWPKV